MSVEYPIPAQTQAPDETATQCSDDQGIITRDSKTSNSINSSFTIHNVKFDLQNTFEHLLILKKESNLKELMQHLTESEWNTRLKNLEVTREIIVQNLKKYESFDKVDNIKLQIHRRQRKRAWLKRRNAKLKKQKLEMLRNREERNRKIDEFLDYEKSKQQNILGAKLSAEQAKTTLSDISKKINDAKGYIQLLDALKELRRVRKIVSQASNTGEFYFEQEIGELIVMWREALQEYELEENNIKFIVNRSNKTQENLWYEILFGCHSYNECLGMKNRLSEFVEIRRCWDSFLVPTDSPYGSNIPVGCVIPNAKPNNKWSIYRN